MKNLAENDVLRESEERLRLAFWAANIGFWTWNLLTQEVYLSPTWKSQLGYEEHELPNDLSTWEKLLHPKDREASWKVIREAQNDPQRIFEIFFRLRHKDQTYRWILSRGRVYRDAGGKPMRIMGCHVDVTQQKEDERLLRQSEARLHLVLDSGSMGMWIWDLTTNQVIWNQREFELLDLNSETIVPSIKEFYQCVHPDDRGPVEEAVRQALSEDRDYYAEFRVITRDGGIRWLAGAGRAIHDVQASASTQMMGVNYDITERKLAEQKLFDNQQRMELILQQLPSILWTTDRELKFTSLSGSGLSNVSSVPNTTVGMSVQEVLQLSDTEHPTLQAHRRTLQGQSSTYDHEYEGRHFHAHLEPLRAQNGDILGCIGVALDVTERIKQEKDQQALEQRVQHAQKLESLEVLAGGIAHDFNNLLTGMLGYANLALLEVPAESPAANMIREIEKAAQRAADLSRQMLAYSGKGKFVIEVIRLDQLVVEMAGLLKTIVSPKAQLHIVADPVIVEVDATQIRQVVMNLITNAADAIQGEGYIAIRTGVRLFTALEFQQAFLQNALPTGEYAYLEVQDNGLGMSPEMARKIFDPFFTTKFTGRGLGLASVLGIVRGHRGSIFVESRPGAGTTFRVVLPLSNAQAASPAIPPEKAAIKTMSGQILVIEDDQGVLHFVKHVLNLAGYQVLATTDSRQALELISRHGSDIRAALIDLTMPNINGIDLARLLRQELPELPILLMSGYSEEEVTPKLEGLPINGFLSKPFKAQDLITQLTKIITSPRSRA